MNNNRPRSVRNIGMVLITISIMLIFSNSMGALMFSVLTKDSFELKPGQTPTILNYYLEMCLTLVAAGILFLIGGLGIRKYKRWARGFTILVSIMLVLWAWICITILIIPIDFSQNYSLVLMLIYVFIISIISFPLYFLIRFLNRKHIAGAFG